GGGGGGEKTRDSQLLKDDDNAQKIVNVPIKNLGGAEPPPYLFIVFICFLRASSFLWPCHLKGM
ncbi:MAG: hypothetical protein JXA96_04230, partial [Sedimentisphaerales bacterium]|nr:hypothetical protein [Sedimentisphaerales bacterium]